MPMQPCRSAPLTMSRMADLDSVPFGMVTPGTSAKFPATLSPVPRRLIPSTSDLPVPPMSITVVVPAAGQHRVAHSGVPATELPGNVGVSVDLPRHDPKPGNVHNFTGAGWIDIRLDRLDYSVTDSKVCPALQVIAGVENNPAFQDKVIVRHSPLSQLPRV